MRGSYKEPKSYFYIHLSHNVANINYNIIDTIISYYKLHLSSHWTWDKSDKIFKLTLLSRQVQ